METATYKCPMCGRVMERNLVLFLEHGQQHIIDKIKEEHPEWVTEDGVCKPCAEFYEKQLSGQWRDTNIGPRERAKRRNLGIFMTVLSSLTILFFVVTEFARFWRLSVFLPVFFAILCFIEERQKTCVVMAELGTCNLDRGETRIQDSEIAQALKSRGRKIIFQSVLWAFAVTAVLFFIP